MRNRNLLLIPFVLFLLVPACFGISHGPSVVRVERTWSVHGTGDYSFEGSLVVNDSHQKVLSIETDPSMVVDSDSLGNIRLRYNGRAETLRAVALVAVDFDTNITSDPPLERRGLSATNLTMWDPDIATAAESQATGASLETIRNLTNFVHSYVSYNISYFGAVRPAIGVFAERQGVCVEYTHLLISMARYLGFDTRFIGGYVNGGTWQPHAWAEINVPGYGWLPVDATFGEVGGLDNSHVAEWKGTDQNSVVDSVKSHGEAEFSVIDRAEFVSQTQDTKGHSLSYTFNPDNATLAVGLENKRHEYLFGTYEVLLPQDTKVNDSTILLMKPDENATREYALDTSMMKQGYRYTIPFSVSFDDASTSGDLVYAPSSQTPPSGTGGAQPASCAAGFVLLALLAFSCSGLINLYLSRQ